MANNLVVQLLLKTGAFSSDLKTARGQIQNFQQGCQTAGKSLTGFGQSLGINLGALAKFGGAVGAATLAGKELKNILDSTQSTADTFEGAIAGCKGVVDQFRTSIATVDFSSFRNGLWQVFKDARNVRDALDQLGNTQIAYDYKSKENQTKFNEALNKFKKPKATNEEKEEAKRLMQEAVDAQKTFAANYGSALYKTYVAQVVKEAGSANLSPGRITAGQFRKAMDIDLGLYGDPGQARANIEGQYKDYLKKLKEYGGNNITGQDELKRKYADVIAIRAMLQLMSDDELKNVSQMLGAMENAKNVALTMERTMNEAVKPFVEGGGTTGIPAVTKNLTQEIEVMEKSLEYWEKIKNEAFKHRNAEVFNSSSWNKYNDDLQLAVKHIDDINRKTKVMAKRKAFIEAGALPKLPEITAKAEVTDIDNIKYTENELVNLIGVFEKLRKGLKEGDPMIARYNQIMDELGKRITNIRNQGLPEIGRSDKEIDYLYSFSSALMSTTSSVSTLASAMLQLVGTEDDSLDGFNKLFGALNVGVSVFTSIVGLLQSINTLTEMSGTIAAVASEEKAASSTSAAAAVTAEAAATVAAKKAEAAAETGAAAAKAADSQAGIPVVGPALAVAAVAAVVSAIIAAMSRVKAQRFANGGIVGGSSFTGDRVSAQVNSGEMILNKSQQANLFRIANGGGTGKEVTFRISGTDLVGVMNNINRKNKMIR